MTHKNHFLPVIDSATSPSSSSHTSSKSSSSADSGSTSDAESSPARSKRGILGIRSYGVHGACAETPAAFGAKRVVDICLARLHYDSSFHRTGFDTQPASGANIFSYPRQYKHLLYLYICLLHIYYITTESPFTSHEGDSAKPHEIRLFHKAFWASKRPFITF